MHQHFTSQAPATGVASERRRAQGMHSRRHRGALRTAGILTCLMGFALAACSSGPQPMDRTFNGVFTSSTPRLQLDDSPYIDYPFEADAGWQITIDMMSDEVDAFLHLLNSAGETLSTDDDGGAGLNAHIRFTVPARGSYVARANTYDSSDLGAYTIRIQSAPSQ